MYRDDSNMISGSTSGAPLTPREQRHAGSSTELVLNMERYTLPYGLAVPTNEPLKDWPGDAM